jgi:hypothetical protein
MNTTHTQGNWHTNEGQIYTEETGKTLALIPYFDKENEEMKANSKLIASAPNLLKALAMAYSFMITDPQHQGRNILETIKEAINKATN